MTYRSIQVHIILYMINIMLLSAAGRYDEAVHHVHHAACPSASPMPYEPPRTPRGRRQRCQPPRSVGRVSRLRYLVFWFGVPALAVSGTSDPAEGANCATSVNESR